MKRECCRHPRASRGFAALIEIIIVMALILGGVVLYMNMMKGSKKASDDMDHAFNGTGTTTAPVPGVYEPQSIPGRAIRKAEAVQCQENLRELRMMIEAAKTENEGKYPPNLESIQGSIKFRECPISHQMYTYNPETGELKCPYHTDY